MNVLVSTDTSCLLNYEVLNKYEISVFPLNVIVEGVEYLDGLTINQDELKEAMRANKKVKTSTPPLGKVIEYFEGLFAKGYDQIIHFTISSKLSSMYQLFSNVSETYFQGKVKVIDSYGLSTPMLTQVLLTYEEVNKGTDVETIVKLLNERKTNNYVLFVPENLTALKNGGRISPAIALIGNTIGLKPVLQLKDGELTKDSMTRNVTKAFVERLNEICNNYPISDYDYCVLNFDGKESIVEKIKEHCKELLNGYDVIDAIVPINVCAHCGPGTIGLLVTPKINKKSLKEFI